MSRLVPLAAILLVGCGEKPDPTADASPSVGKATFAPANSAKSNPVGSYKTAPAGQGDALK